MAAELQQVATGAPVSGRWGCEMDGASDVTCEDKDGEVLHAPPTRAVTETGGMTVVEQQAAKGVPAPGRW